MLLSNGCQLIDEYSTNVSLGYNCLRSTPSCLLGGSLNFTNQPVTYAILILPVRLCFPAVPGPTLAWSDWLSGRRTSGLLLAWSETLFLMLQPLTTGYILAWSETLFFMVQPLTSGSLLAWSETLFIMLQPLTSGYLLAWSETLFLML